jgi:hypothetical protein
MQFGASVNYFVSMARFQICCRFARSHLTKLRVRYHGQTTANHRQTMYFDVCLEWFRRTISRVRSSQGVRRVVLGDAQIAFQGCSSPNRRAPH